LGSIVTVMNMKGGVGKTTVALHLAGMIGRYRMGPDNAARKVLAIDYDPQFNMSQAFLAPATYFKLESDRRTTLSILIDDDTNLDPYELQVPGNHNPPKLTDLATQLYKTKAGGGLDLIPSTLNLMSADSVQRRSTYIGRMEVMISPLN